MVGFDWKGQEYDEEGGHEMDLWKDEGGQGLIEYALVLILVAVVVIAILTILEPQISEWLCNSFELRCPV